MTAYGFVMMAGHEGVDYLSCCMALLFNIFLKKNKKNHSINIGVQYLQNIKYVFNMQKRVKSIGFGSTEKV